MSSCAGFGALHSKLILTCWMMPEAIIWMEIRHMRRPPKRSKAISPFSPIMFLIYDAPSNNIRDGNHARKIMRAICHVRSNCVP